MRDSASGTGGGLSLSPAISLGDAAELSRLEFYFFSSVILALGRQGRGSPPPDSGQNERQRQCQRQADHELCR